MTLDSKRCKFAVALGWQISAQGVLFPFYDINRNEVQWRPTDINHDLDACHVAEDKLTDDQWATYLDRLWQMSNQFGDVEKRKWFTRLNADQKFEALGFAFGLWK